jgi:hypothetical protein
LTDTTLTRVFRRDQDTVAETVRLVVRWDRETGWAHLAIAVPGTGSARFAGFHQFADGDAGTVLTELAAAGCVIATDPRADDDLMELEAVAACREVATRAAG